MPITDVQRRRSIPEEAAAWDTNRGGGSEAPSISQTEGEPDSSPLIVADLVDVYGVPIDGTATMVDNVLLAPGMRVLRASAGGSADNGVWIVPDPITDDWERYRPELLSDGLRIVVTNGLEDADTATSPNVPFGGYRDTVWQLVTKDPIAVGSTAIEFRQASIRDGVSAIDTGPGGGGIGAIFVPPFPGIRLNLRAYQPFCAGLYITPIFGLGEIGAEHSGLYWLYCSILCSHATAAGVLAGGVFRNSVLEKRLFQDVISTTDEQHKGGTLVRMVGDGQDRVDFHIWDPAGAGYVINATDVYADAYLVARR